jgi:hypothetical protein
MTHLLIGGGEVPIGPRQKHCTLKGIGCHVGRRQGEEEKGLLQTLTVTSPHLQRSDGRDLQHVICQDTMTS